MHIYVGLVGQWRDRINLSCLPTYYLPPLPTYLPPRTSLSGRPHLLLSSSLSPLTSVRLEKVDSSVGWDSGSYPNSGIPHGLCTCTLFVFFFFFLHLLPFLPAFHACLFALPCAPPLPCAWACWKAFCPACTALPLISCRRGARWWWWQNTTAHTLPPRHLPLFPAARTRVDEPFSSFFLPLLRGDFVFSLPTTACLRTAQTKQWLPAYHYGSALLPPARTGLIPVPALDLPDGPHRLPWLDRQA